MSRFSEALREARIRADLTQKELAQRANINDSYISRIERESSPIPGRKKVLAIADALGMTDPTERLNFLLIAGRANGQDFAAAQYTSATPRTNSLFQANEQAFLQKLHLWFTATDDVATREQMIELTQLLLNVLQGTGEHRRDASNLIRSFLLWLKFRYKIT